MKFALTVLSLLSVQAVTLKQMGQKSLAQEKYDERFDHLDWMDQDGDGMITWDEFSQWVHDSTHMSEETKKRWLKREKEDFDKYDTNGSGIVGPWE